jgi:uncharacterized membrane protein YeaQ/YmgE (transglycosylase-associated protein family)
MVSLGLRSGSSSSDPKLAQFIAGESPRERQRYVLGAVYPYMFLFAIPFGIVGAAMWRLIDLISGVAPLGAVAGLIITFVPASVMSSIYVYTFAERLRGRDPAALVLTATGRKKLPRLSKTGYLLAVVLGVIGAFTWARP